MPLCPQITNTPITVSLTADFTVTNVVPVLPANTEQLAEVDADAQQALIDAQIAQDAADAAAAVAASSAAAAAAAQASANTALSNAATAQSTANSAASAASAAQSTATTALANAATAYTAAIGSLQPSASTIVNASNQMTAINGGGITVYSGSSATTGARVVLNSAGLAGFNSSSTGPGNGATFSISASTGAAVFSGSVTGATITGSDLNIAGVFLVNGTTGVMTATSATVTGTINATSGYFGTATNGWSIGATGLTAVGTGNITGGSIVGTQFTSVGGVFSVSPAGFLIATSGTIGGMTLSGSSIASATGGFSVTSAGVLTAISGTIGGMTLASNSISSATGGFSVTSAGVLTASSGTIGGSTLGASSITGGTIQTSSGSNAVVLSGSDNAIGIKSGGAFAGFIASIGSGSVLMHYGTSPSSTAYPRVAAGSVAATLSGTASAGYSANSDGTNTIAGTTRFFNSIQVDQSITAGSAGSLFEFLSSSGNVRVSQTYAQAVSGRAMQISSAGLYGTTASTRRKKHQIESYKIDSAALLNLDVKTFKYNPDIDEAQDTQYGFIAEEAQELGLDELIQYDSTGVPDYFAYEKLPIFLLQLIQELKAEINQLKGE